jgi:hypothetical protein
MTTTRDGVRSIRTIERDEWGDCTYAEGWTPDHGAFSWEHDGTNRQLRDRLSEFGFGDEAILEALGVADQFLLGIQRFTEPRIVEPMPIPRRRRRRAFIRSLFRRFR